MSLFHHILPYLTDSVLMNELPDNLLVNVLFPVLQIITSRSISFIGGWRPRSLLLFKLLDVVYLVGLRIGEEMARSHLTPLCTAFFSSFDKVYDSDGQLLRIADESSESKVISGELSRVLTPEMTYTAYLAFYNLLGRTHLDNNIINLEVVKVLCLMQQEKGTVTVSRPAPFSCLRGFQPPSNLSLDDSGSYSPSATGAGSLSTGSNIAVSKILAYILFLWLAYYLDFRFIRLLEILRRQRETRLMSAAVTWEEGLAVPPSVATLFRPTTTGLISLETTSSSTG